MCAHRSICASVWFENELDIFFYNGPATTEIYTLSLHDALPILLLPAASRAPAVRDRAARLPDRAHRRQDRKSTRLNSSHVEISYAVFCLKKKRRMAVRAAEIHEAAFGQQVDRVAFGEGVEVDLRLDVGLLRGLLQAIDLDLVVEVADVAHQRVVLHALHVFQRDHVAVTGGGDVDVGLAQRVLD